MNFFQRIWNVIRGKSNRVLETFENPSEQLSVFVEELNSQVKAQHESVAKAVTDEKRLRLQIDECLKSANEWEKRAEAALSAGNEGLAREALFKKSDAEAKAQALQKGWEAQKAATDKLKEALANTKSKVEEARRKYSLLVAQYQAAQAKQKVATALSMKSSESPALMMQRLEDKILRIEAETEADMEMQGVTQEHDLEAEFVKIEKQQKGDAALLELKQKMASRALPDNSATSGQPIDEIAQLKAKLKKGA